jgi:hypothetical protein
MYFQLQNIKIIGNSSNNHRYLFVRIQHDLGHAVDSIPLLSILQN